MHIRVMAISKNDICIGTIIGAHGVHGAVRVRVYSDNPDCLLKYKNLKDAQGRLFHIKKLHVLKDQISVVKFDGVQDCNEAEELKGIDLFISRDQFVDLEPDVFYIADLVGLKVKTTAGKIIGEVQAVENHGAGDFLTIFPNVKDCIPFTHEAVPEVNFSEGYIIIDERYIDVNEAI